MTASSERIEVMVKKAFGWLMRLLLRRVYIRDGVIYARNAEEAYTHASVPKEGVYYEGLGVCVGVTMHSIVDGQWVAYPGFAPAWKIPRNDGITETISIYAPSSVKSQSG